MALQRFYLLLGIFVFVLCISNSTSVAPGDFDAECIGFVTRIPVSPNEKVLLDTQDYESQNLITIEGESDIWKSVDFDGIDMGGIYNQWVDLNQGIVCRHRLIACDYMNQPQKNWLITQYINISDNGVDELTIYMRFSIITQCACQQSFSVWIYETNVIDETGRVNDTFYSDTGVRLFHTTEQGEQTIATQRFTISSRGMYLSVVDGGSCTAINRILVYYNVCPYQVVNMVVYPETVAPPFSNPQDRVVTGTCVDNASPISGNLNQLECEVSGTWGDTQVMCSCNAGYENISGICEACMEGEYKHLQGVDDKCIVCPENSNSTDVGALSCDCLDGYYRVENDMVDSRCTIACNVGEYKHLQGDDECIVCPENSNSTGVGALSCDCLDGYYRVENDMVDTRCTIACNVGEYKHLQGDDKCIVCPENSNSTDVGALSCDCLDGYYRVENDMVDTRCTIACNVGEYKHLQGDDKCIVCPENSNSTDVGALSCDCLDGYYRVDTRCTIACNVGEYKRLQGDDECIVCPENSNSTGVGALSCDCLDGYYRAENYMVDTKCTIACNVGEYKGDDECIVCPENSNSTDVGALSCDCLDGYYRAENEDVNTECTTSPTAPLDLEWNVIQSNSISISWSPPSVTGGRTDLYYVITYTNGSITNEINNVTTTHYTLTGLSPQTSYTISVISMNGVSDQDPNINNRTSTIIIDTNGDTSACMEGEYKSLQGNGECIVCPENSNSPDVGALSCDCLDGYYRAEREGVDTECTTSPTAPLDLEWNVIQSDSICISWSPPSVTGGRTDLYYVITYTNGGITNEINNVTTTHYTLTGLSPQTSYTISVISMNGVSDQDPNINNRTSTIIINTNSDTSDLESRSSESETATVLVLPIVVGILVLLLIVSIIVIVVLVCERQIKQINHPSVINLRPSDEKKMQVSEEYGLHKSATLDPNYDDVPNVSV